MKILVATIAVLLLLLIVALAFDLVAGRLLDASFGNYRGLLLGASAIVLMGSIALAAIPSRPAPVAHGSNPFRMTGTAGTVCIGQVARKCDQAIMRFVLHDGLVIARVAGDAILWRKGMGRAKPGLLRGMALQAGAIRRRTDLVTESRIRG